MGRVKLQIKKIENTTNRQVTFSKRRNGLIKKAYELSVLCDVDVALIMFSPSGRLSIFSGNKSMEEIMARYVNLPEHERGQLHNQEYLQRALAKLKDHNNYQAGAASPVNADYQLEEIQQEIHRSRSQLEEMEKRLKIFEGHPSEITTVCEAQRREHILEETLKCVRIRKRVLEEKYDYSNAQPTSQVNLPLEPVLNVNGFVTTNPNHILDWMPQPQPQPQPQRDSQQVQIMNFLDSHGLLPLREQGHGIGNNMLGPPSSFLNGQNMQLDDQASPSSCGMDDDDNNNNINNMRLQQQPHFGIDTIDANISPWTTTPTQFYPTGEQLKDQH